MTYNTASSSRTLLTSIVKLSKRDPGLFTAGRFEPCVSKVHQVWTFRSSSFSNVRCCAHFRPKERTLTGCAGMEWYSSLSFQLILFLIAYSSANCVDSTCVFFFQWMHFQKSVSVASLKQHNWIEWRQLNYLNPNVKQLITLTCTIGSTSDQPHCSTESCQSLQPWIVLKC